VTFSYDKGADVMYLTFEHVKVHDYIYVENSEGDILRLDRKTKRIIGITLPFFSVRLKKGPLSVPEIGLVPFNESAEELVSR
jgi:uncharacterized protein YuzE